MRPVVKKIIQLNVLIYAGWYAAAFTGSSDFMVKHFLVSWSALLDGRPWTVLTSVFSHNMLVHLFLNLFVLYNFGPLMESLLGSKRFLGFYLSAGLFGSLGHCLASAFILHQPQLMALGASGAISGVIILFALLFPKERIFLFGFVPLPAIWAGMLFIALDLSGLISQTRGSSIPIGYGAHLGGALCGIIYFGYRRLRRNLH